MASPALIIIRAPSAAPNGLESGQSYVLFGQGDPTPPVITPMVGGTLGSNGWYTSDVTITWEVSDPESPVSIDAGCTASVMFRKLVDHAARGWPV